MEITQKPWKVVAEHDKIEDKWMWHYVVPDLVLRALSVQGETNLELPLATIDFAKNRVICYARSKKLNPNGALSFQRKLTHVHEELQTIFDIRTEP